MPNWKKVITSGSDASLNGLIVTNNVRINASGSSIISGSFVVTGSSQIIGPISVTGDQTINGNILITGNITAQQYIISSSVYYVTQSFSSGSTIFGNSLDDRHQFTGSLYVTGSVTSATFIGNLTGTGSWASNAVTASYISGSVFTSANPALSASFALTASHALNVSPPVIINNNTDNFIVTATGTSLTVQGEPNFKFNGSLLQLTGSAIISGANASLIVSGTVSATNGFTGNLTGTSSWSEVSRRVRVGVLGNLLNPPDDDYYVLMMRESQVGSNETSVLTTTSSMVYSASLGLLYVTASWAYTSSQAISASHAVRSVTSSFAISASYAANAAPTVAEGSTNEIQYNAGGGVFGGVPTLTYDGSELIGTGRFSGNLRLGVFRGIRTSIPTPPSKGSEVLVYTQYIPAATFTDDDIIRVHYRINQQSSDASVYRIYIADTGSFNTIAGSLSNLIANVTASSAVNYVGIKRDLTLDAGTGRMYFMNSGSAATSDDITDIRPVSTFDMDWNGTDYWMYFSAIPNQVAHTSKALSYSIERV